MQPLNCFARNFFLAPEHRLVFQHGPEQPSQAPKPPEGKKETPPEKAGKDAVDAAKGRLEKLQQNKFKERVDKVQELQKKMATLDAKQTEQMKGGKEKMMDSTQETEYKLIHEQMADLAKQFNAELGLNIDFQNLQFLNIEVKGKGLYVIIGTEGADKKYNSIYVGLRPDGTFETRNDIGDKIVCFDSRTNKRAEYKSPTIDNPYPDNDRFRKEQGNHVWPSTE